MKRMIMMIASLSMVTSLAACGDYSLKAEAIPGDVSAGGTGKVEIQFKAKGEYHITPEGMVRISFEAPPSIVFSKTALTVEDRSEQNPEDNIFSTDFTVDKGAKPGPVDINANIMFQLCTDKLCRMISEDRVISLNIR